MRQEQSEPSVKSESSKCYDNRRKAQQTNEVTVKYRQTPGSYETGCEADESGCLVLVEDSQNCSGNDDYGSDRNVNRTSINDSSQPDRCESDRSDISTEAGKLIQERRFLMLLGMVILLR